MRGAMLDVSRPASVEGDGSFVLVLLLGLDVTNKCGFYSERGLSVDEYI